MSPRREIMVPKVIVRQCNRSLSLSLSLSLLLQVYSVAGEVSCTGGDASVRFVRSLAEGSRHHRRDPRTRRSHLRYITSRNLASKK